MVLPISGMLVRGANALWHHRCLYLEGAADVYVGYSAHGTCRAGQVSVRSLMYTNDHILIRQPIPGSIFINMYPRI